MPIEPQLITNRVIAVVTPKPGLVDWINRVDPEPGTPVTLAEASDEPNSFLIPADIDDPIESAQQWLKKNWNVIFERMLEDWYVDRTLWPQKPARALFEEWCDVRFYPMVFDCSDDPIEVCSIGAE